MTPATASTATPKAPRHKPPKKAGSHGADAPQPALTAPAAEIDVDAARPMDIPLGLIEVDDKPDRVADGRGDAAIDELASSMARFGLQSRIQVTKFGVKDEEKFRLVFGSRRLSAAKRLKWVAIKATLVPYTSEDQVLSAREVENLQREDLNPVERGLAVARLLDMEVERLSVTSPGVTTATTYRDAPREVKGRAVVTVAQRLAKPEGWVRDCVFFARLSGKARQAVLEGRLPALHAREIAKIADVARRDDLAAEAAASRVDEDPMPLDDVRRLVSQCLLSLAQVPWKLDVAFAGYPACSECPSNSANTPGLFDHYSRFSRDTVEASRSGHHAEGQGTKEPSVGVCSDRGCFTTKTAAASRATSAVAAKVASAVKSAAGAKKLVVKRQAITQNLPSFVPARAIEQAVDRRLEHKPAASPKSSKSQIAIAPHETPESAARKDAQNKLVVALRARCKAFIPQLARALKDPGAWAVYHLFTCTKVYQATQAADPLRSGRAVEGAPMASLLAALKKAPSWEAVVAMAKESGRQFDLLDDFYDGQSGIVEKLADVYGIKLPPPPRIEDFLPKELREPAEKPVAKWKPGTITKEEAAKLAEDNSAELLTRNAAKIVIIHKREMVVHGSVGSHDGGTTRIMACAARLMNPGERKGRNYANQTSMMSSGKLGLGDHTGQEVTAKGARWMLGESFEWSRKDGADVLRGKPWKSVKAVSGPDEDLEVEP